jgi:group I intron endonuclease
MYYTIYKITNKIDGKFYIGSHKTKNLDDNYMGSGKYLKHAQEKYGLEYFEKEILYVFETSEEMYAKEAEIVNEDFLAYTNTYNLKIGGFGGWDYLNETGLNNSTKTKEQLQKGGLALAGRKPSDNTIEALKKRHTEGKVKYNTFTGKTHTTETKQKISEKNSKHQKGLGNSQYGTMWITNGVKNKKIKKYDSIPDGWSKGRKIKLTSFSSMD